MGIFGIAKRGFGKAVKAYKQTKIKSGKATRQERIKYGERSPTIKSVKPTKLSKERSITKGKDHFYMKNIHEMNKHKQAIAKGKEAKKKIKHMKDTKRAYSIGDYDAPADPSHPPKKGYDK
ncbi:hypothetical protein [uncultured Mediterranean phage]|nr:hypothetical protein [uncultured Mediterranean phage]